MLIARTKQLLRNRGVPDYIIDNLTPTELADLSNMVPAWDRQQASYGTKFSWEDCPDTVRARYFGDKARAMIDADYDRRSQVSSGSLSGDNTPIY